ncbi:hypothetical protein Gohar_004611 [Gossypium harknessii]|uniref:DUF7745 domain-containing protein n=1 Tax=Gossypium harknessii TaxID=34285 RepID=A0A7J9H5D5_9ROSI|nr:hypothetical protein [Gossypium harknessii]
MEKRFLDKVEDNAAARIWSEKTQQEKGDSLTERYMSELWDLTRISVTQDNLQELKEIWDQWDDETKQLFYPNYDTKKRVDVFALSIYGLVIFPKALGHINDAVSDLFDWLDKRVTPVLAILAETSKSLSAYRRAEKVSYRVFSENYSPLKEFVATPKRDNIFKEKWMEILQSLQDEDVELRALWMIPVEILYRCGDFDWVPLLGIWGVVDMPLYLYLGSIGRGNLYR